MMNVPVAAEILDFFSFQFNSIQFNSKKETGLAGLKVEVGVDGKRTDGDF